MPYCEVGRYLKGRDGGGGTSSSGSDNVIEIFYRICGHGKTKALLIIGLAGTHNSWGPLLKGLTGADVREDVELSTLNESQRGTDEEEGEGIQACCFDNRGIGRSSIPKKKSDYSTKIMARDALALLDHLGWRKAHVIGHSMGAMIACKLASMAPNRIASLALLNVTGGGFQCFPKIDWQMISIIIRFLRAATPEERAAVDLDTHYTKEYLDECIGPETRRSILYREYVKAISSTGMQSSNGFDGQVHACWYHKMTSKELERIRTAGFLVSIIHGRHDIIAQIYYARKLAAKLQPVARMIDLHGAHLVSHERPEEVNEAIIELINAAESNTNPREWSNLQENIGCREDMPLLLERSNVGSECSKLIFRILGKIHVYYLYFLGLFFMALEHARKITKRKKLARVMSCNILLIKEKLRSRTSTNAASNSFSDEQDADQ